MAEREAKQTRVCAEKSRWAYIGHVPQTAQIPKITKIVKQWFWAVAKHMLKKWSKNGHGQKGAGPRRNPKLSKTPPWGPRSGPQGGILLSLGFFLGRLPFGGDHFLTTFLAYVLGRPKTIILPFLGFGLSRGHGLYNQLMMFNQNVITNTCKKSKVTKFDSI